MGGAGGHGQLQLDRLVVGAPPDERRRRTAPAHVQVAGPADPAVVRRRAQLHRGGAEAGAAVEDHPQGGVVTDRLDPAQQDHPVGVAGEGQGIAALRDRGADQPAAAPDQGARLVGTTPDEARVARLDGVDAGATEQLAEHGVVVPPRCTQEGDVPAGADQGAALAIGDQCVLPQRLRWERRHRRGGAHWVPRCRRPNRWGLLAAVASWRRRSASASRPRDLARLVVLDPRARVRAEMGLARGDVMHLRAEPGAGLDVVEESAVERHGRADEQHDGTRRSPTARTSR